MPDQTAPAAEPWALTPEQHIRGVVHNAVTAALAQHDHWVRLGVRQAITDAVLSALPAYGVAVIPGTELERLRQRAEQAESANARVRQFSEMVIASSIRLGAIEQAHDTLAILDGKTPPTAPAKPRPAYVNLDNGYPALHCADCDERLAGIDAGDDFDQLDTKRRAHQCESKSGE
ncbi:hypothetical protein HII36_54110 [Nonomuraea sp. NN258]|uniref:hypothetical protein n=1 Tax=Nonomuraea antri TaxID=2730852 RepID=UPI001569E36D|nr:hypothetical protein [Nonomuraea antri]NRQ40691.1 hypothetical protein [Nonomuraea antri]